MTEATLDDLDELERFFLEIHDKDLLRCVPIARWALLHAKPALEWERDRCGMLSGPLKEALAAFPSETI
jgi:hypothetical protein